MMEAATRRSDEPQAELKRELEAKEQELKRLQENDKKIRHRLKAAKKKKRDLEMELKKMPIGVVLKGESKTLELMKSGKKWHISCYPQLFNASDYTQSSVWIGRWTSPRALKERYYCSWDVRSMSHSQYADMDDSWEITGVPAMRALKKEYLQELSDGLSRKTVGAIRGLKSARRVHYFRPTHTVHGAQFRLWSPVNIGVQVVDWGHLWGYPSTDYWVFSSRVPAQEIGYHNRSLMTVDLDIPRSWPLVQALCDLNSALCIRLRPWDGIFLEHFAPTILGLPWVADMLRILLEKKFVSVWVTSHVTLEALKCKDTYRTDEQFEVLSPFFSQVQVWRCEHASSNSTDPTEADADHECADPPEFPKDATSTWLALKL
ncbi:hypothetical protein R1sor_017039 [Riccia sorocarpa]|uniref:Uncharacterized protein n=1 Tax=Riccia sorocarpa TaxID=122646 RepID=A0ABD3I5M7_9MARC